MSADYPYAVKDPEFRCELPDAYMGLEAAVELSSPKSGDKMQRHSGVWFRTDNAGGYPMRVAVRTNSDSEWFTISDIGEVYIQISGDYEASSLRHFFQHVAFMMLAYYGRLEDSDAVCE